MPLDDRQKLWCFAQMAGWNDPLAVNRCVDAAGPLGAVASEVAAYCEALEADFLANGRPPCISCIGGLDGCPPRCSQNHPGARHYYELDKCGWRCPKYDPIYREVEVP